MSWLDAVFPIVVLGLSVAILMMSEWLSKSVRHDEVAISKQNRQRGKN